MAMELGKTTKTNETADPAERGQYDDDQSSVHSVVNTCGQIDLKEIGTNGSNQEVFSCGVCGMRFNTNDKMYEHMRIHENFKGKLSGLKSKNSERLQTRGRKHNTIIDSDSDLVTDTGEQRELGKTIGDDSNQKSFSCEACGLTFKTKKTLSGHRRLHTSFTCQICGWKIKNYNSFRRHKINHEIDMFAVREHDATAKNVYNQKAHRHYGIYKKYKLWKCQVCGSIFRNSSDLKRHDQHHIASQFKCRICKQVLLSSHSLQEHFKTSFECSRHMQLQHLNRVRPGRGNHVCEVCNKDFCAKSSLMAHAIRMHRTTNRLNCDFCHKTFKNVKAHTDHVVSHLDEKPYMCDTCGKTFMRKLNLTRHEQKHTVSNLKRNKEKDLLCEDCGASYATKCGLKMHRIRKHLVSEQHVCDICGEGCASSPQLVTHRLCHSEDRPFECNICGKGFKFGYVLNRHKTTHTTRERPFKCELCGNDYMTKCVLKAHMRTHSSTKHTCDQCGKTYATVVSLKTHTLTHTGDKPYKCSVCGKGFTQHSSRSRHELVHSGEKPYKCDVCGMSFNQSSSLQRHVRLHTGDKPYKCDVCGMDFTQSSSLSGHKRVHHPDHTKIDVKS